MKSEQDRHGNKNNFLDADHLRSHAAAVISVRLNDSAARALGFPFDAVADLAETLPDRPPTCCITGANDTNGTFRFHQVRPSERWINDDPDGYLQDMIIVIENKPQ